MFKVSILTRLLRQECGWDEARTEKLTRHLCRLGYQVHHSGRDACELIAEKELDGNHYPGFWLDYLKEEFEQFEPNRIIWQIELFTDTPIVDGSISHGIPNPSGREYYKFSIGCDGREGGSVAYLKIMDAKDFTDGLRLFRNQVAMFTIMVSIFREAQQTMKLIHEKHEFGGALRNLDNIKCTASRWASTLLA